MIFYLLKAITIISVLFYLFISIRLIVIGLINQSADMLDRGLKILAFTLLIIFSSIAILLFISPSISPILIFFISFIIPVLLFIKETKLWICSKPNNFNYYKKHIYLNKKGDFKWVTMIYWTLPKIKIYMTMTMTMAIMLFVLKNPKRNIQEQNKMIKIIIYCVWFFSLYI